MKLIRPSYKIAGTLDPSAILEAIEAAGRTCYKSEDKITEESAPKFIDMVIRRGHESVLEHEKLSVRFICDRGVSHEIVRHRIASFSQESTRYCNYSKDKSDSQVTFIIPPWVPVDPCEVKRRNDLNARKFANLTTEEFFWLEACQASETTYMLLTGAGWRPEQARTVLNNSLKTEIVLSANLREWREIFRQRTASVAHPQMRELMRPLLKDCKELLPVVFDDINY